MCRTTIEGFLLTRQWYDRGQLHLRFWLNTDQGPVRVEFDNQDAVFFVESAQVEKARERLATGIGRSKSADFAKGSWYDRAVQLINFQHEAMHAVYFKEQRWLYRARDLLKQAGVTAFEADLNPADRFLMERFITGSLCVHGEIFKEHGIKCLLNPQIKKADYSPRYKVLSLDIETSMQGDHWYSIALLLKSTADESLNERKVFMIGPAQESGAGNAHQLDYLHYCEDERSLMQAFLQCYKEMDPDIIIGWAVINFDLRFLQRKADQLKLPLKLGRGAEQLDWRQSRDNDEHYTLLVPGRLVQTPNGGRQVREYTALPQSMRTDVVEGEGRR